MGWEGAFFGSVGMGMMHFCVLLLFSVFFWIVLVCVLQRRCIWWGKMEGHITSHSLVSLPSHGWLRTNSSQLWIVESVPHSWRWLRTKACGSVELAELWNSLKDMNSEWRFITSKTVVIVHSKTHAPSSHQMTRIYLPACCCSLGSKKTG